MLTVWPIAVKLPVREKSYSTHRIGPKSEEHDENKH